MSGYNDDLIPIYQDFFHKFYIEFSIKLYLLFHFSENISNNGPENSEIGRSKKIVFDSYSYK